MAQYSTDFSEYTTGAAPSDWTARWGAGTVFEVRAGGDIGSKHLFIDAGTGSAYTWDDIDADANRDVVDVLMAFKLASVATSTNPRCGALVLANDDRDGYFCGVAQDTTQRMRRVVNNTEVSLATDTSITFATATLYWLRMQRLSDNTVRTRMWVDGGSEPGTWQISVSDSNITAAGAVGIYSTSTASEPEIHYFAVGTNGDSAPSPGGGGDTATPTPAAGAATVSAAGESLAESTVTAAAGAATVSAVGGTLTVITSSAFKNNTGTVLASLTNVTAWVHNPTTGALVVKLTGQTTNASGVLTLNDAAIVSATTYRVVYRNEDDGAEGMETVTAS